MRKFILMTAALLLCGSAAADPKEKPKEINLFGTKAIQLGVSKDGIKRKEGGHICELKAINGAYSEWGETDKDARELVLQKCSKNSGRLLCSRDKITCKEDK
jgi:hypothetical protein